MSANSHRNFYNGTPRPRWAGTVQAVSKKRVSGFNRLAESTEISGLVLPVSPGSGPAPAAGPSGSFGHSLGFPSLGAQFANMHPDLQKNWGKLEQIVGVAAARVMGWNAPQGPQQASRQAVPANALHLRAFRQTVKSTRKDDAGRSLRPDEITGEVSKVFGITDVSGTQLRFESAGSSVSFRVTPSSLHLSRDPKTL